MPKPITSLSPPAWQPAPVEDLPLNLSLRDSSPADATPPLPMSLPFRKRAVPRSSAAEADAVAARHSSTAVLRGLLEAPSPKRARTDALCATGPVGAALDKVRLKGLDVLVGWIQDSHWASEAGDIAPQFITRVPNWPAGRALEVHVPERPGKPYAFGPSEAGKAPVRVWREDNHYQALVGPDRAKVEVPGDGNCFFHAVLRAMHDADPKAPAASREEADAEARLLRLDLASLVRNSPHEIAQWVDLEKIAQAASRRPGPAAERLPDLVGDAPAPTAAAEVAQARQKGPRAGNAKANAALLGQLRALMVAGDPAGNAARLRRFARQHGEEVLTLQRWIGAHGEIKLAGRAVLQRGACERSGFRLRPVGADLLKSLRDRALGPERLVISDDVIVAHAHAHGVSISYLRKCIGLNGDLRPQGQMIVEAAANALAGVRYRRITVAAVRELQAMVKARQIASLSGAPLLSAAGLFGVSPNAVRTLLKADGALTPAGEVFLLSKKQRPLRFTSEILLDIHNQIAQGRSLAQACEGKAYTATAARKFIDRTGRLTAHGINVERLQEWGRKGIAVRTVVPSLLDKVRELKASQSDQALLDFAEKNFVDFATLRRCFDRWGALSWDGKRLVARYRPPPPPQ